MSEKEFEVERKVAKITGEDEHSFAWDVVKKVSDSNKRLVIALVITILAFAITNGAWLYSWQSYDYVSEEITEVIQQDGQGTNIVGNKNEVKN